MVLSSLLHHVNEENDKIEIRYRFLSWIHTLNAAVKYLYVIMIKVIMKLVVLFIL